jgi:exodeoxyribonuclease VII large subunit
MLERGFQALWVEGEISNFSRPSSGHWYFSIKDESAQLRCAMFRQKNILTRFTPKDGAHVQIRGRVSLYEPRGDYQFIADFMEDAGEGALRRKFELLKTKLAAEGLFATDRKRSLPRLPKRIGVVTSPTGAAIRDVINILRRRFCTIPVLIYPVPVQGAAAAAQIAAAIRLASVRRDCDVLIVARGGGSLEDLWSFNEEVVARAIFDCSIPVVSGVGHEVDFTIADFVADVRAPTPSGAAELVAPDCGEWTRALNVTSRRLVKALERTLTATNDRFTWLQRRFALVHPGVQLRQQQQRVDELEQRLVRELLQTLRRRQTSVTHLLAQLRHRSPAVRLANAQARLQVARTAISTAMHRQLRSLQSRLAVTVGTLDAISPLATLQRGYAIVTNESGHVVTDAMQVARGDRILARVACGVIEARIESVIGDDESLKDRG